jgi:hypothetical protein
VKRAFLERGVVIADLSLVRLGRTGAGAFAIWGERVIGREI